MLSLPSNFRPKSGLKTCKKPAATEPSAPRMHGTMSKKCSSGRRPGKWRWGSVWTQVSGKNLPYLFYFCIVTDVPTRSRCLLCPTSRPHPSIWPGKWRWGSVCGHRVSIKNLPYLFYFCIVTNVPTCSWCHLGLKTPSFNLAREVVLRFVVWAQGVR